MESSRPLATLIIPLIIGMALCVALVISLGGKLNVLGLLVSQQGDVVKEALHGGDIKEGRLGIAPIFSMAVIWWALDRRSRLHLDNFSQLIFRVVLVLAVIADVMSCIATVDRTALMPLIAGILVVRIAQRALAGTLKIGKALVTTAFGGAVVIGVFLLLSFIRGAKGFHLLMMAFLGYTIVSYNRLTALLHGSLSYSYGGVGIYMFPFLSIHTKLSGLLGAAKLPLAPEVWKSEFSSMLMSGLNPIYIWSGTFGYLYADLGWWSLVYLSFAGVFAGFAWSAYRRGTVYGQVIYPWVAFWILFWLGWNVLFAFFMVYLVVTVIFLYLYEWMIGLRMCPLYVEEWRG
jgi:hypothetical protein